ncbi:MAG: hypothetical protein NC332_03770, partial [Firmicutes bacterium]|nr:hypothetical protein [Bacillota bacterium]
MKRKTLLCCLLVLVLCLSALSVVACKKTGISDEVLQTAYNDVVTRYGAATETPETYEVAAVNIQLDSEDNEYTINLKWEILDTTLVTLGEQVGSRIPVQVPATREADISYKLKVTLVDAEGVAYKNSEGAEYTKTFDKVVPKSSGADQASTLLEQKTVKNPVAGTAYKWVTFYNYEYLYFKAELNSAKNRLLTTDYASSPSVYLENAEGGGFHLYFMDGTTKTYINMTPYIGSDKGETHNNSSSNGAYISTGVELTTETTNLLAYKVHESGALYVDAELTCDHGVKLTCSNMFAIRDKYPDEIAPTVAVSYFTDNNKNHVIMVNECPMYLVTEELKVEQEDLTEAEILERAFALGENETMDGKWSLTGTLTSWNYDESYKNGNGKMTVGEKEITLFRMAGDEAKNVAVGDKITVTGILENHTDGSVN